MNYGLYKKMEIFVSSGKGPLAWILPCRDPILLARKTSHETRNDPVSLRRIRRVLESDNPKQHELVREGTVQMSVTFL